MSGGFQGIRYAVIEHAWCAVIKAKLEEVTWPRVLPGLSKTNEWQLSDHYALLCPSRARFSYTLCKEHRKSWKVHIVCVSA